MNGKGELEMPLEAADKAQCAPRGVSKVKVT